MERVCVSSWHHKTWMVVAHLGPRPPSFTAPSNCVADVATPYRNPLGSLRSLVVACRYSGLNLGGSGPTEKLAIGSKTRVMFGLTTGFPFSTTCHTDEASARKHTLELRRHRKFTTIQVLLSKARRDRAWERRKGRDRYNLSSCELS